MLGLIFSNRAVSSVLMIVMLESITKLIIQILLDQ